MHDDVLDLGLELVVVGSDFRQSPLLVTLEVAVQGQQSADFGLLGSDHFLQTVDVGLVVGHQTALSRSEVLLALGNLLLVEGSQLL